jgi:hypothetical protein
MEHREDIGRELRGISKVVADIPAAHPFVAPEGFFEQFPEKMLAQIRLLKAEPSGETAPMFLTGLKDRSTLQAPPGYFDGLAEQMLEVVRGLSGDVLPSFLEDLRDKETLRVPQGYFEGLPDQLLLGVKASGAQEGVAEELQRLSPFLAPLPRNYPGTVPTGYFEQFVPRGAEAVVVPIGKSAQRGSIHQLLAAAVIIGVVLMSGIWGYHIYLRPTDFRSGINLQTPAQLNTALARIPDQAIVEYLKSNTDVSDADLIASEVDEQSLPKVDDNAKDSE